VKASEGLPDQISKVVQVATELQLTLFDGITSEQLDEAVIHTALQNVKDDPDFDKIAARLLLKNIYKNILGDYESDAELKKLHAKAFPKFVKDASKEGCSTLAWLTVVSTSRNWVKHSIRHMMNSE
jgi:ribonucleoside-diphosphate reductase alpha chain